MTTLILAAIVGALAPADSAALTQLRVVVDSAVFHDLGTSAFLPRAYGAGFLAGPAEVRLCDRLACLVFVPEDTTAGLRAGDVTIGVRPVSGSALAERLTQGSSARARVVIAEPPPPPDFSIDSDDLPPIYHIEAAIIAVPLEDMSQLDTWLRSAGADVYGEGQGLVAEFPYTRLRLVPAFREAGPQQITFRLRREVAGDPTYRFGALSRLRFGPGRQATWSF